MQIGELRESSKPTRCAYCHAEIGPAPVLCRGCGTLAHGDCLATHGRCPTLGCGHAVHVGGKPRSRAVLVVLASLLVILVAVAWVRSRPGRAYVPTSEGTITAKRWSRSVSVIERLAPRAPATGREVVLWKAEPYATDAAERWQIKRVEKASGSELPARWPTVVLAEGEREHERSESLEFDVTCPSLDRTFTFWASESMLERYRIGDQGVVTQNAKFGLEFENTRWPEFQHNVVPPGRRAR